MSGLTPSQVAKFDTSKEQWFRFCIFICMYSLMKKLTLNLNYTGAGAHSCKSNFTPTSCIN